MLSFFQCDPNLEVYGVWINTLDPRLPRIALFAKKDIDKGVELTFDYMMTGISRTLLTFFNDRGSQNHGGKFHFPQNFHGKVP